MDGSQHYPLGLGLNVFYDGYFVYLESKKENQDIMMIAIPPEQLTKFEKFIKMLHEENSR